MNQITDPDKVTNREAAKKLAVLAPIVLLVNVIAAMVIWGFKDSIFNVETTYLASLITGALLIAGLFSYVILKIMSMRMARSTNANENK